jgi:hypothetical protein
MNSRKKSFELFVVFCLLLVGLGFVFRQDLMDWHTLRTYDPPASVEKITKTNKFTDLGKRYFYVARPAIVSGTQFNQKCRDGLPTEFSIVLGCYINTDGIYLFRVTDKRLNGIIEVTAAHEMLHSAYDRLSSDEKSKVDKMVQEAYQGIKDDRIRRTIEQYKQQDPSSVPNELHSILGTELANLPADLENYYKQYFKDRTTITDLSSSYESEFSSRQNKADQIGLQLSGLKAEIDSAQQSANQKRAQLLDDKGSLDDLLASGNTDEYNSRVDSFNNEVAVYNALVKQIEAKINSYNSLVAEYQEVSVEINDLYQSIDSRPKSL